MGLLDVLLGREMDPEIQVQYDEMIQPLMEKGMRGELASLPRPAEGNPSLERMADVLESRYPKDMAGVKVRPDWSEYMYTTRRAAVDPRKPNEMMVNAMSAALAPQWDIDASGAHELEHIRQLRDPIQREVVAIENYLPYDKRGYELKAREASEKFRGERPTMHHDGYLNQVYTDVFEQLRTSPIVKTLLQRMNGQ